MGMNYYLRTGICPHCGHAQDTFHIGKSAYGWRFLACKLDCESFDEWRDFIKQGEIIDEEHNSLTVDFLINQVIKPRENLRRHTQLTFDKYYDWGCCDSCEHDFC